MEEKTLRVQCVLGVMLVYSSSNSEELVQF